MSRKYRYTGKLSYAESVIFLVPSQCPFQIPLPLQGEGKRAWRARVRAGARYDVGRLIDDDQAAPWFVILSDLQGY